MRRIVVMTTLALLAVTPGAARDLDGVNIPDTLVIQNEQQPLVLNGSGYFKTLLAKVYIGSLYLSHPVTSAERVMNSTRPRVMHLHYLRDTTAAKQASAWRDGFAANLSTFEIQGLRGRIREFLGMLRDLKANEVVRIHLLPRGTTQVWINDTLRGTVEGGDFQIALLKVWLGHRPVDKDLKRALLAGKK